MPAKLSKFVIDVSCKQYAHPWSDSCISTTAGLGLQAIQECLRIYSTLYFLTLLTKGRVPNLTDLKKTFISIFQSTAFLSWSAFAYSMFICIFRRLLGNFNILTVSFIPSFFSSLTAIILERPSRRTLLCLYVSNIATETLFRMAVYRGYVPVVPQGQVYIFAAGMATLLYLFRNNNNNSDSIYKILRIVLGPHEEKGYIYQNNTQLSDTSRNKTAQDKDDRYQKKFSKSNFYIVQRALKLYKDLIDKIKKVGGRHHTCPHPNSCVHYTMTGGLKMFSIGFCVEVGLKLIFQLKNIIKRPKHLREIIFKKGNLNLACFLGGFAALYKLVSCSLRRINNKDSPNYAVIAGLIASTFFAMYPDNTIALYIAWKALQLTWNKGVELGKVPEVKWFVIFLYCFSTATLFHAAIVEPQNLRISYWKFLYDLSGGRIAVMSRIPINEFGLDSYKHLQDILRKTRTHDKHIYSF
ncbi:transmembrane protein 135-like [Phymastichus coffea]|uniref:transmembrane protein 135-like n=1 Tax=Phymastichus coffea TaxID=108790 RepID=UPI00273C0BEF|nr:transmembrane protein 135-like [Phymastichus coffea]XP_058793117.1 transmembrane protein 135-like [Phymastichus coffea]